MVTLRGEVKAFIVHFLVCFGIPLAVIDSGKKEFGVIVSRQQFK